MSARTAPWPAGVPCWANLTVPDVAVATSFYADVLGWAFEASEEGYGGDAGAHVGPAAPAGIGPQQIEGMPAAWTLFFASEDVDATAAAVRRHGGRVLAGPDVIGAMGRLVVAADPTGAVFGAWEHGAHIGAGVVGEPGGMSWEDLRSTDPVAAAAFYSGVFGWTNQPLPADAEGARTFARPGDDAPLAGVSAVPEGTRSHWLVYFAVADTDAAVAAAEARGGTVLREPFDTRSGRLAALRDPAGAVFWVAEPHGG